MAGQIIAAKRMGFTIEELSGLTVAEVLEFADLCWPEGEGDEAKTPRVRMATQEDIDRFMS